MTMQMNPDGLRQRLNAGLPLSERTADLAGIPTAILEGGEGPPLILLHGLGEFAAVWGRVITPLTQTHRVIVPDLPGHGGSGAGAHALDAGRGLAWLDALIAETCEEPPAIMGHLLGGAIATRYAVANPSRITGLVLVDSFGLAPLRPSPGFALALAGFMMRPTERSQERVFRRCFVSLDGVRRELDDMALFESYALQRAQTPETRTAIKQLVRAFSKATPPDDLRRLSMPVSMIWGRDDLQVKVRVAERAHERYGWPLHVIDGARDDPAFEQPVAFMTAARTALGITH